MKQIRIQTDGITRTTRVYDAETGELLAGEITKIEISPITQKGNFGLVEARLTFNNVALDLVCQELPRVTE